MKVTTYLCVLAFTSTSAIGHNLLITLGKDDHGINSSFCKATPGTTSWPSEVSWSQFNQSLGGGLLRPPPPGAVCHPGQSTYDAERCDAVATAWRTYDFHSQDPVSNMWNQYSNDSCLPNVTYPCSDAGYPTYAVNATEAEHVRLSFRFAQKYNVRLVVKSSGHDFQGRSTAPGALTIWIHHMQRLQTLSAFQPQGCDFTIEGDAVTVAGGTQMVKIYEELDKINQTAVGGGGKTVSVGGYITGGGHSILAPRYGLAADQVLEMEVVTPKGEVLVANECQNKDLFWAMRGGGGSTFGVVTLITMATHPTPQIVAWDGAIASFEVGAPWFWDMIGYLLAQLPYLDSKGISGYPTIYPNVSNPIGQGPSRVSAFTGSFILQDTQNVTEIQEILQPVLDYVRTTWPQAYILANVLPPYPSFLDWYADHYDRSAAGTNEYVGSHLMNAKAFEDAAALGAVFKTFSEVGGGSSPFLVAGAGVRNAKPRGGGNSVCPAWRKALVHATNGISFPPLDPAARQQALADLNAAVEPVRQLSPNMGAYVNERLLQNNPGEPDWQHSFWGQNYERLHRIKRAVDPHDLLWCHPCVGNERWEEVGYRLCRISDHYK
ncbi:hypothetical protein BKA67DRAFT_514826 [Truncatella angustata]|uniref:FAD-binding PCMH-type domain-containing protein n=1 Tax=Truncatella angustata TaxID=152316 RepID=A0A9P8URL7_9PEZI|nr:uncharacterized protein BKA67DRAFT_514826 [Truncatella angustata]KAH6657041.1 hypothetical protein BKA67DRAFT_514826 [Truncatella angustata]